MSDRRTYGTARSTENGWIIESIEPHAALALKRHFPRIPRHSHAPFELTGGPSLDADLDWFLYRYPLRMTQTDAARISERTTLFHMEQAEVMKILAGDWKPTGQIAFKHNRPPYHYQQQAAEMARRLGRLLIMDDVGLGKTVSALATIAVPECLPAAVVVPAHLADQWVDDYIEAFTHLKAHVIKKTKPYKLPPADIYVFKYSNIYGWVDYLKESPFKSVIFDEMQELRTGLGTAKGTAARVLVENAGVKVGLTASPVYNFGDEIFAIMEFLDPGALGTFGEFVTEWCKFGRQVKDPPALGAHLRDLNLAIRRTESDAEVASQIPPLNTIVHNVPWDEKVAAESAELARKLAIAVTTADFHQSGVAAREFNLLMRHTTGVAKARHVAAYVRFLIESDRQVLLAGWHREVYDIWNNELGAYDPVMFTGSESPAAKKRSKAHFIAGRSRLMIMSLRSGTGLDGLQEVCHTGVVGELDWSPQVHKQFFGRLRRPGQRQQVDGIYVVTDGGSDPAMVSLCGIKADQAKGIVDPFAPVETQVSDVSRIKALAEAYLQRIGAGGAHP